MWHFVKMGFVGNHKFTKWWCCTWRCRLYILALQYKPNKTWSSVSNSSLSKTFALCRFEKLKVQKLCFFPPNIVFGLKKNESKNYFGSEKMFVSTKILGPKKCWSKKYSRSEKNSRSEKKICVWTKFLVKKKILSEKNFRSKNFFVLVTWVIWTPNPLTSAKSSWLVYLSNFSLLIHTHPIDFGEGCSCSSTMFIAHVLLRSCPVSPLKKSKVNKIVPHFLPHLWHLWHTCKICGTLGKIDRMKLRVRISKSINSL